jgi:hypothetical protein
MTTSFPTGTYTIRPWPVPTRQDYLSPAGTSIREAAGLLTVDEAAERYGVDAGRLTVAMALREVGSVTFSFEEDGSTLDLLPVNDGAVAEWLAAQQ